jgi:hypothetical protein
LLLWQLGSKNCAVSDFTLLVELNPTYNPPLLAYQIALVSFLHGVSTWWKPVTCCSLTSYVFGLKNSGYDCKTCRLSATQYDVQLNQILRQLFECCIYNLTKEGLHYQPKGPPNIPFHMSFVFQSAVFVVSKYATLCCCFRHRTCILQYIGIVIQSFV